jgi:hypothetical protein
MTRRLVAGLALPLVLAPASFAGGFTTASAQIINVPTPRQVGTRPVTLTASFGFLQSQSRNDGQSGTGWILGEALQWKAMADVGLKSGGLGVTVSLASQPIQRIGGSAGAGSDGTIDLRQVLATFRTRETEGAHQIIEASVGLSQWANYRGTDVLTAEEREARNALTLGIGYGIGFTFGQRGTIFVMQDLATLWGSREGLSASQSRQVQQYTTRLGVRYRIRGMREPDAGCRMRGVPADAGNTTVRGTGIGCGMPDAGRRDAGSSIPLPASRFPHPAFRIPLPASRIPHPASRIEMDAGGDASIAPRIPRPASTPYPVPPVPSRIPHPAAHPASRIALVGAQESPLPVAP